MGAEDSSIELWLKHRHHADHRVITDQFRSSLAGVSGASMPLVSIDHFLDRVEGPFSFVKIDVQGYELPTCRGMEETLRRNPGVAMVLEHMSSTMRDLDFSPQHLIRFLTDLGFDIYCVHPKGKLSKGIPPAIADSGYVDLLFSRYPVVCGGDV